MQSQVLLHACLRYLFLVIAKEPLKLLHLIALTAASMALAGCSTSVPMIADATWTDGACTETTAGVTVTTDFRGAVTTHCAVGYKGDSWKLLKAAGFEVKGTRKYPTAFACTIDGLPKSAKCDGSNPVNAYWAYYLAEDKTYEYAASGASDHQSICGTTEAWVYTENEGTDLKDLPVPRPIDCTN